MTLKEIKNIVAEDITYATLGQIEELKQNEDCLEEIGYSMGMYGCNGKLLQGRKSGKLYKITKRTSTLFMV